MQSVLPRALKEGDTIAVVAPANWISESAVEAGVAVLEARGFKVKVAPQVHQRFGKLAGSDSARVVALHEAFADPEVGMILCVRGGSGCTRLLDALDYDLIARHPKLFVGMSDMTALHLAFACRAGLNGIYGPTLGSLARPEADPRNFDDLLALAAGRTTRIASSDTKALRLGTAEGTLVGGCLSLLCAQIGTPYDWSARDGLLFFEDVGEDLYKIDRMLWHLKQAGRFEGLRGVVVGEMCAIRNGVPIHQDARGAPYGFSFEELLLEKLPPSIPIVLNFPMGHGSRMTSLPLGRTLRLTVETARTYLEIL